MLIIPMLSIVVSAQNVGNEESQEPAARVARVSYLSGEARIQRIENEEWESVVNNLPLVEGDMIQTDRGSKLEIQLDRYGFLRLDENSTFKFTFLADEGVAISLSRGSLGITLIRFDKETSYLEIDAPDSTVAIQKSGVYRIDAGDEYNKEVRVSVRDEGEARVYSSDAGFTLKDDKSARLFLDGSMAGEWETSRISNLSDSFGSWIRDRDEQIASDFTNSDNQYYDDDVYGADDLRDNGDWTYTTDYGYIWRPHSRAIAGYSNWSPYRYGNWRWLPYYGWTWVNDEPWGWATYHYGRWIYHRGHWYWTPYRQYRSHSSWRPAFVFVTYVGGNYCWYPLPWGYGYYDYNRRYKDRWEGSRRGGGGNQGGGNGGGTTPTNPQINIDRANRNRTPPLSSVPPGGVITARGPQFGRKINGYDVPTFDVARQVLSKDPVAVDTPPILPDRNDLDWKLGNGILVEKPRRVPSDTRTGAATRKTEAPLDEKLRQEKMYGNRTPRSETTIAPRPARPGGNSDTGVFDRTKRPPAPETKESDPGPVYTPPTAPRRETRPAPRPTYSPEQKQPESRPSPPSNRNDTPRRTSPRNEPAPSPPPRRAPAPSPPPTRKAPPQPDPPARKPPASKPPLSKPSESPKGKPDNR